MLFYTGMIRTASTVAESYVKDIDSKRRQLRILKDLVDESITILNTGQDIAAFGELLHEAWESKRNLSAKVTNHEVDAMYAAARAAGALGGKLTGAGGGGFLLLFVPPAKREQVRKTLKHLVYVPFKLEFQGSQLIFFEPDERYPEVAEIGLKSATAALRNDPPKLEILSIEPRRPEVPASVLWNKKAFTRKHTLGV